MPNYFKFEWEGFKVKAEPVGIRKVFQFLPYVTGNKLAFKVTIKTISGEQQKLQAHLHGRDPSEHGMDMSGGSVSHLKTPIRSIKKKFEVYPISMSGDHIIRIDLTCEEKNYSYNLVTFRAIAHEVMLMWTIGILVAIGATILNVVF